MDGPVISGSITKVMDVNGACPSCVPSVHTSECIRCGDLMQYGRVSHHPCRAVPANQRWTIRILDDPCEGEERGR